MNIVNKIKKLLSNNTEQSKNKLLEEKINYENLFNELVENYPELLKIEYSNYYNPNKKLNCFYNNFFNKYNKITIGSYDEFIVQNNYKDFRAEKIEHPKNSILIGIYYENYLYLKQNSIKNGVYDEILDFFDNTNNLEIENPTYESIYHLMVEELIGKIEKNYDI